MTPEQLKQTLNNWNMNKAQAAQILCVHNNSLNEYLSGVTRIPCTMEFSIEVLGLLDEATRNSLFRKRLDNIPQQTGSRSVAFQL